MVIKILPNDKGNPPGKLADAELHFDSRGNAVLTSAEVLAACADLDHVSPETYGRIRALLVAATEPPSSPLDGLKLIGFGIWERRTGGRNITFPARQYSVNGERRSFALLRPIADTNAQNAVRDAILAAYAEFETAAS